MTPKQKKVYTYMKTFKKKNGYNPGLSVIANALGDSKGSIQQVFGALFRKGLIIKRKSVQEGMYEAVDKSI